MNLSDFFGPNAGYVLELYERYRENPDTVDPQTRALFDGWSPPAVLSRASASAAAPADLAPADLARAAAAAALARSVRAYGHMAARLDPLGGAPPGDPALELGTYGLSEADLAALPAEIAGVAEAANALEAIRHLRAVYSGTTGYDFEHLTKPEERAWLRDMVESCCLCPPRDALDERALLAELTRVEVFERFLQRAFVGQTRFSIEGLDLLVPMLNTLVGRAAEAGTSSVLIGMAHRGRLNVMAHVVGKPYEQILAEFQDPNRPRRSHSEGYLEGYTGDVKYHLGVSREMDAPATAAATVELVVKLASNPSHLEFVNPVVEGMARAAGERESLWRAGEPEFNADLSLPVLIHGDAAFPGQGVVAETLNLSGLPGYSTGGTIHIIGNNQLGFTTTPAEGRSTRYASDLAKGFKIPVVHVNADDPGACIVAARLAHAYRARFHKDFMIDLIGYRRYGHNEGDEPSFTQPVMYAAIGKHPTARELLAAQLVERGAMSQADVDAPVQAVNDEMQRALDHTRAGARDASSQAPATDGHAQEGDVRLPDPRATEVSADELRALNDALLAVPEGFTLNPKLQRSIERRRQALAPAAGAAGTGAKIDWAHAETLAFATLLAQGVPIRLTGQDTERGTFTQRHLVFHDWKSGATYTPMQHLPQARASFAVHNSALSENAVVGFEYGYNIETPGMLVLWEAQYGDFVNGAQVMVDQFITSARAKWGERPSLVLLLPHGYEGQGPEHSSGRLERFLQLAAADNLRVAYCTTAAQYFHLLRRHAGLLENDPRPLVVMTPKRLLRHPLASSDLHDLTVCCFQPVLADAAENAGEIRRLILCSGKVYVDLVGSPLRAEARAAAVARVEQLYPFPADEIRALLQSYPALQEVVWLQEEPENMGAWSFVRARLGELLGATPLRYIGRPEWPSPAEGSAERHEREQQRIVTAALSDIPDAPGRRSTREVKKHAG